MQENRHFPKFVRVGGVYSNFKIPIDVFETVDGVPRYIRDTNTQKILAKALNYEYELIEPKDGPYGALLPDGNWSGIVGLVHRGEADFALGKLSISEVRLKVVDYTNPYQYIPISFITDKPQYYPDRYAMIRPFSLSVWIAVVVSLILVQCVSWIFKINKYSFQSVLLDIYGILVEKSINFSLSTRSVKILIFSWTLGAMLLSQFYKALLLAFLTFPTLTGIRNIEELAKATEDPSFKCSNYIGTNIYVETLSKGSDSWKKIANCLVRSDMYTDSFKTFLQTTKSRKAFLGNKPYLKTMERSYFISDDLFYNDYISVVVGKKFCCKHELDKAINRVAASGLLYKFVSDEEFYQSLLEKDLKVEEMNPAEPLTLEDLMGAFVVLVLGHIVACFAIVVEILVWRRKKGVLR